MELPSKDSKVYQLLYADNDGAVVGLDDVQLLETIPPARLRDTEKLLESEDLFVRFQATLILTAWANELGIAAARWFIENPGIGGNFSPHRIGGQDNRFDDLAEAIDISIDSGEDVGRALDLIRNVLGLYADHFFQSKLKFVLLARAWPELKDDLKAAIAGCLKGGSEYQASQLLAPLAKIDPIGCWNLLPQFLNLPSQVPDPAANIAECLQYIADDKAVVLLKGYLSSKGPGVAAAAQESLKGRQARSLS